MDKDGFYILFLAVLLLGLPIAAAFPSIDILGMFSESSFVSPATEDRADLSPNQEEFVDRMYGNQVSAASSQSQVDIEKVNNRTYAYPKGVNVSKFDEQLFDTGLMDQELYSDMDSFNIVIELDGPIDSGSREELPEDIIRLEDEGLVEIRNILKSSDSVALRIKSSPGEVFQRLNEMSTVERGSLDARVKALNLGANGVVGAGEARQSYSINGTGEILAVLDTGVEASHIDFASRVVDQKDYSGYGIGDQQGHGTHVSGTVLGDGSAENGYYPGMSQNGSLMSVKVLGDNGYGSSSDIQAGIEYAADNNASVISMSLGGSNSETRISNYNDSVQYARDKGSVVVAAAGNDGGYTTVGAPGSVPDIITVGAVDDGENLASFSSKGPESVYYNIKPEVTAPGYGLSSTSKDYPSTNYTTKSGTSMATPVVSGILGLVKEQNPSWTVEEVENAIIASGEGNQIGDGKNVFERGTGVINASKAVDPELKISETRFNYGNISASQKHSRVISLENPTGQEKNYSINSEIHMYNRSAGTVESGSQASITFNQSSISLPAGESRDIEMYLEINEEYSEPYGGLARFEGDESYVILVGGFTNNVSELNADISLNATTIDVNDSVQADGSGSTDPEGNLQSYNWDMGDSTSLNGEVVEHSYDSKGDYTIQLTVEDGDTNQDTETANISVEDLQPPQAVFSVNETEPEASIESVEFNASQSSDNVAISHYLWDLDGDSVYDQNTTDPVVEKTYSTVGLRNVELKVVDTAGNSATADVDIDVMDTTPPEVDLVLNSTSLTIAEDVEMDGSGSTDNTGIDTYSWSYDSETASTSTVVDDFSNPGLYDVKLNVSDSYGNHNSTNATLNVSDETDPEASIDVDPKVSELGEQVNFSGSNSSDNLEIVEYRWDLNNDSTFEYTGVNVSETVDSPGNYSIALEVEDNSSNTGASSTWFYVNDTTPPEIELDIDSDYPETGEQIMFNASNTSDNDYVKTYDWDLDTTTINDGGASINHDYSSEGSYIITLNATDNSSNTASEQYSIDVKDFNGTIESPVEDTSGEEQWINISFTRNVSALNASLNSSDISLDKINTTFYAGKIGLDEQEYQLEVEANDTYSHQDNLSTNFTNSITPNLNSYTLSENLAAVNSSVELSANISEDNYENVSVQIERPNGTFENLELQNQSATGNESVIWNSSFIPDAEGDYSALLNVTDTFGENITSNKSFKSSESVDFNLTVSGELPEFKLTDFSGKTRYQNTTENITSVIPSDSDWEAYLGDTGSDTKLLLNELNISNNVSENIEFEPALQSSPDIELFEESTTFAADIPLNYSTVEITVNHSGSVEEAYRCSEWDFQSEVCDTDWTDSSSNITTLNSSHAALEVDSLSAYTFGYTEDEDDQNDEDDGGSSGGSGGSTGYTGYTPDPEIVVEESENRVYIYNIYEAQSLEFNQTGLPITGLEFESSAENGTIEFKSRDLEAELSFASVFQASSNISGPYTLRFEIDSAWLEEKGFQASEVSLYRKEDTRWEDQEAELLDELEDRAVYEAEVEEFSTFGIGVNRACYSAENVTAETDESCMVYSNPCEVPDNAEKVESCQRFDEKEEVIQEIEEKKKQVKDSEKVEKLSDAEELVKQGDIDQARQIVQNVKTESGLDLNLTLVAMIVAPVLVIAGGLTAFIVIRRRRLHSMVIEMGELIDMLKDLERQGINVRIPAMKLQQANKALQKGNYSKAEEKTEEVKEYLKREL